MPHIKGLRFPSLPAKPTRNLDPDISMWVMEVFGVVVSLWAILTGAFIINGGEIRWTSPSFRTALTYPYAPESWGWVVAIFGLAALAGMWRKALRPTAIFFLLIGIWGIFFASAFSKSAVEIPTAATTGPPTYGALAFIAIVLAGAYFVSGMQRKAQERNDRLQEADTMRAIDDYRQRRQRTTKED